MKKGDKAIVVSDSGCKFKPDEKATILQVDDSDLPYYIENEEGLKGWMRKDELRPAKEPRETDPILFIRLYDGIWETNVERLVVVYENIVTKPLETTGRYLPRTPLSPAKTPAWPGDLAQRHADGRANQLHATAHPCLDQSPGKRTSASGRPHAWKANRDSH